MARRLVAANLEGWISRKKKRRKKKKKKRKRKKRERGGKKKGETRIKMWRGIIKKGKTDVFIYQIYDSFCLRAYFPRKEIKYRRFSDANNGSLCSHHDISRFETDSVFRMVCIKSRNSCFSDTGKKSFPRNVDIISDNVSIGNNFNFPSYALPTDTNIDRDRMCELTRIGNPFPENDLKTQKKWKRLYHRFVDLTFH